MKIIVACDSFKGCMSSKEVEESIKKGILKANNKHEVLTFPMADRGEGTAMVFCDIIQGKTIDVLTVDAYGKNVFTTYCISQDGQLAIMDVASCIGLNMTGSQGRRTGRPGCGVLLPECDGNSALWCQGRREQDAAPGQVGILNEFVCFYNLWKRGITCTKRMVLLVNSFYY